MHEVAYQFSHSGSGGLRQAIAPDGRIRYGLLADAVRGKDRVIAQQKSVILQRLLGSGVALIPGTSLEIGVGGIARTLAALHLRGDVTHIIAALCHATLRVGREHQAAVGLDCLSHDARMMA